MSDSTVTIQGQLTRDPELRFTQGGKGVASFGVAVARRYQQNNEWVEQTSFFNVTAWGQLGENASASLAKGSRVIVVGRLEQRTYETQAGEKRNVVEIVAEEIGASFKWATATIKRTTRGADAGHGERQPANATAGAGRAPDPVYGDEEPF